MRSTKTYIAFFDLDKTILNVNSGSLLVKEAYKRKALGRSDLLKALYLSILYKYNLRNPSRIIVEMGRWLKGVSVNDIISLSDYLVSQFLLDSIRTQVYMEIELHKKKNAEVAILSSALEEICNPIGKHLGINTIISTRMETVDGIYTGKAEGAFCFEEEKKIRLNNYCIENKFNPDEAYYYGDSISDLPAMSSVGNPICISPDKKLRRIARSRDWQIYNW